MTPPPPRDDVLVSVCLSEGPESEAGIAHLVALAAELDAQFRYWEVLAAIGAESGVHNDELLRRVHNLRLLRMRPGTSFYQRRFAVASEAIGDIVVLTAPAELPHIDIPALIARAEAEQALVIGQHAGANPLGSAIAALGRSAGLRIGPHDMLTAAYPRAILNIVMVHPDRLLALRFPPIDERVPVLAQDCRTIANAVPFRGEADTGPKLLRRINVLHRLMIGSASRVLTVLALASLVTATASICFAIYAVIVWLCFSHVQPGWFTTALALSLSAAFLGSAVFGLSIGIQRLIEAVGGNSEDFIADESGPVNLFGQVIDELNVAVEGSDGSAPDLA